MLLHTICLQAVNNGCRLHLYSQALQRDNKPERFCHDKCNPAANDFWLSENHEGQVLTKPVWKGHHTLLASSMLPVHLCFACTVRAWSHSRESVWLWEYNLQWQHPYVTEEPPKHALFDHRHHLRLGQHSDQPTTKDINYWLEHDTLSNGFMENYTWHNHGVHSNDVMTW